MSAPCIYHLLSVTKLLADFWFPSSFILYSTYRNSIILRIALWWNVSNIFTSFLFTLHVLHPHNNKFTGVAAHNLHLVNMCASFDSHMKFKDPITLVAFNIIFFSSTAWDNKKFNVDNRHKNDWVNSKNPPFSSTIILSVYGTLSYLLWKLTTNLYSFLLMWHVFPYLSTLMSIGNLLHSFKVRGWKKH